LGPWRIWPFVYSEEGPLLVKGLVFGQAGWNGIIKGEPSWLGFILWGTWLGLTGGLHWALKVFPGRVPGKAFKLGAFGETKDFNLSCALSFCRGEIWGRPFFISVHGKEGPKRNLLLEGKGKARFGYTSFWARVGNPGGKVPILFTNAGLPTGPHLKGAISDRHLGTGGFSSLFKGSYT